jgi:hypothetical protein
MFRDNANLLLGSWECIMNVKGKAFPAGTAGRCNRYMASDQNCVVGISFS